MVKRTARLLSIWAIMGMAYMLIEVVYKLVTHGRIHPAMIVVGGLCGIAVGGINQIPRLYSLPMLAQSIIGAAMVLLIEFASGCILNLWLGLGVWDYSGLPLNVMGQICPQFGLIWLAMMPFAIWLEDTLRWGFGWDGKDYTLGQAYKELIIW